MSSAANEYLRPDPWAAEGSFVIERYSYVGPKGGKDVQWIVWRVKKGELVVLGSRDTLSEALEAAGARS